MSGFELVKRTRKHSNNVAARPWSPWAQFDASDRRFNPADTFEVFAFFFSFFVHGDKLLFQFEMNNKKHNRTNDNYPYCKSSCLNANGAVHSRETENEAVLYITRKGRDRNTVQQIVLYIHTQVVLNLCQFAFFFLQRSSAHKRWLEIQPTIRSLANCHLRFHISSVQDILPFQMKKYFLSILCTAYCSNALDW